MSLLLSASLVACEEESEAPSSSPENNSVHFEDATQTLREDDATAITVTLAFSQPAAVRGMIDLEIDAGTRARIQTLPAHINGQLSIPFTKGASQLQFIVAAINNDVPDGDAIALIRIKPSEHFDSSEGAAFQLTLHDDDEVVIPSIADFADHVGMIAENRTEPVVYSIRLSAPVALESQINIHVASSNTTTFVTNPAAESETITLTASVGTTELSFTLTPLNNAEITGATDITFSIQSVTGSVIKGTDVEQKLTISDDELTGKLRGYETVGADSEKRLYAYDAKGRIATILRETSTGFRSTDTYYYDAEDRLVKINKSPGRDVHYLWSNGRIERAEAYQDGALKEYANYAYDDHGNIAGAEPYHRQVDGSFKRGLFSVYLYFTDGNIYKSLLYQDVAGQDEPVLIRTRTYDNYLPNEAVIPMVEIIPGMKSQKNLAGRYREEGNTDVTYWLTYEFNEEGLPVKRTASAPTDTQVTAYQYY